MILIEQCSVGSLEIWGDSV